MLDANDLEHRFAYHPPTTDQRVSQHQTIRSQTMWLAKLYDELIPDGREKALAITNLEQSMFWANAAIARG